MSLGKKWKRKCIDSHQVNSQTPNCEWALSFPCICLPLSFASLLCIGLHSLNRLKHGLMWLLLPWDEKGWALILHLGWNIPEEEPTGPCLVARPPFKLTPVVWGWKTVASPAWVKSPPLWPVLPKQTNKTGVDRASEEIVRREPATLICMSYIK